MASRVSDLPDNLQLKILTLVAGRQAPPARPSGSAPHAASAPVPGWARRAADGLAAHGHASSDAHLSEPAARALHRLAEGLADSGQLRPARVGQSHAVREDARSRADSIAWLPFADHPELAPLASSLGELCAAASALVGEPLELPRSAMLARYPARSAGYTLHRDASELTAHRLVTAILYLNEGWGEDDGGQLVLYPDGGPEGGAGGTPASAQPSDAGSVSVVPAWNRLLAFRSHLLHRVLPTGRKPRLALTAWLQRAQPARPVGAPSARPTAKQPTPPAPDATIFVSVPAYRDPEMQHTLHDLFARAQRPGRVSVGLVWQGDTEAGADAHCFSRPLPPEWAARVRTRWLHFREARGPTLARALAQQLCRNETHYLQIDSHSRFVDGWDEALLEQLRLAEEDAAARGRPVEPRVIVTTYPAWYERPDLRSPDDRPPLMCARSEGAGAFGADGLLRLRARTLERRPQRPVLSLFWAAGFAFSRSDVVRAVPYDPDLPFLFFGEETTMGARLWTHGYDFYAPSTNLVFHLWDRSYRETFWQVSDELLDKPRSVARVHALLEGAREPSAPPDIALVERAAPLGLGSARTLEAYEEWCGVSFRARVASRRAALGGQDSHAAFASAHANGLCAAVVQGFDPSPP